MIQKEANFTLVPDEKVVAVFKINKVVLYISLFSTIALYIVALFVFEWFGLSSNRWLMYISLSWAAIGMIVLSFYWYNHSALILTNIRIIHIDTQSIFAQKVSEIYLNRIQNVSTNKVGPLQNFLDYGDITLFSAGSGPDANIIFQSVANPEKARDIIFSLLSGNASTDPGIETPKTKTTTETMVIFAFYLALGVILIFFLVLNLISVAQNQYMNYKNKYDQVINTFDYPATAEPSLPSDKTNYTYPEKSYDYSEVTNPESNVSSADLYNNSNEQYDKL